MSYLPLALSKAVRAAYSRRLSGSLSGLNRPLRTPPQGGLPTTSQSGASAALVAGDLLLGMADSDVFRYLLLELGLSRVYAGILERVDREHVEGQRAAAVSASDALVEVNDLKQQVHGCQEGRERVNIQARHP